MSRRDLFPLQNDRLKFGDLNNGILPVHKHRKFSHVCGQISLNSSKTIRPTTAKRKFQVEEKRREYPTFIVSNLNIEKTAYSRCHYLEQSLVKIIVTFFLSIRYDKEH